MLADCASVVATSESRRGRGGQRFASGTARRESCWAGPERSSGSQGTDIYQRVTSGPVPRPPDPDDRYGLSSHWHQGADQPRAAAQVRGTPPGP
ncbi:hypothetical protein FRAHR75_440004 [Frankia sp. Hr75.2]|nr:hypothetical protein FRAHR75_440004 [Frankia sp. Hr75.2]